jgi:hypothetical protein
MCSEEKMLWDKVEKGKTIGQKGSENGCIIEDEEYKNLCRITLEINGEIAPYSITCGIYGLMCHTTFARDEIEGKDKYQAMKEELQAFMDSDNDDDDDEPGEWCNQFTTRW